MGIGCLLTGKQSHPTLRHNGRSSSIKLIPRKVLLLSLQLEFNLNLRTEGHKTLLLIALLSMVAAQRNQLFADGASSVGLPFAGLGVTQDTLHLGAAGQATVGITALAGVEQRLDAALDGVDPRFLWVAVLFRVLRGRSVVQIESEFVHFVGMAFFFETGCAQIIILSKNTLDHSIYQKKNYF